MLEISNLSFSYPDSGESIIDGLSIEVVDGEIVSLVGESGCGKTTLLSLVAEFAKPDFGEIRNPFGAPVMVFQRGALFEWLTVLANVEFPLLQQSTLSGPERRRKAVDLLAEVGLGGFAERHPYELSGGQRRRVELARAWASEARLVLLDEPFVGLDYRARCGLQNLLRRLWRQGGRTVIAVTHDPEEACFLSDRVLILGQGSRVREVRTELGRERSDELRYDEAFLKLQREVARL